MPRGISPSISESSEESIHFPSPYIVTIDPVLTPSTEAESARNSTPSSPLRAPTMSPTSGLSIKQERPFGPADYDRASKDSVSEDRAQSTSALSHHDFTTSTTNQGIPASSPEELQVQLLRVKVEEAATTERTLQQKVELIWREKDNYDNQMTKLEGFIEATKTDIKGLHAKRRAIEADVKQKKDRLNDLTWEKHGVEGKSQAKWEEGKALKRDADAAARTRWSLEKELKEAKFQEELVREYPDSGLREFVKRTTSNETHCKLINAFVEGQPTDRDLDTIEDMLEEAEDGAKDGIKLEVGSTPKEGHSTERAEPLVKTESVTIKVEGASAPAPIPSWNVSSSSTAESLLEAVRQMKASRKNLQAQLHKINSLKRKRQDDIDNGDSAPAPRRRVMKHITYAADTDSSSDEAEQPSDKKKEQGE